MFVKIICHEEDKAVHKGSPRTKFYDCKKFLIYKGNREEDFSISIDIGEQRNRIMQFPKKNHSVIVMNNSGDTIDKYCW